MCKIEKRIVWLKNRILLGLFPFRCPICDEPNSKEESAFCKSCLTKLQFVEKPRCKKCGKSLGLASKQKLCADCENGKHRFDRGRVLFEYGDVAPAIYRFKYKNRREYAGAFARKVYERLGEEIVQWEAEALIPVPLHKSRRRTRGYNQAELLAEELGRLLQIPVYNNLVVRCRKTAPQKRLNAAERQNNLKRAFKIDSYDVNLRKVILIDDIYTTGQTLDEIAGVLQEGGVKHVYFLALAAGSGL